MFQFVLSDVNSGVNWHRSKRFLDIIGGDTLPFLNFDVLTLFLKVPGVFDKVGVCPVRGLRILSSSFATSYVNAPLLDTMGLKRMYCLWILGNP